MLVHAEGKFDKEYESVIIWKLLVWWKSCNLHDRCSKLIKEWVLEYKYSELIKEWLLEYMYKCSELIKEWLLENMYKCSELIKEWLLECMLLHFWWNWLYDKYDLLMNFWYQSTFFLWKRIIWNMGISSINVILKLVKKWRKNNNYDVNLIHYFYTGIWLPETAWCRV